MQNVAQGRIGAIGVVAGAVVIAAAIVGWSSAHASLSCTVTSTCNSPSVVVLRLQATTNSHAEMPSQANYANLVCCTGDATLSNSCSGTQATVLKLSSTTNAHVEENTGTTFTNNACLSLSTGTVTVAYQSSNCTGFDTTILSIAAATNSHAGDSAAYTTKVCGSTNIPQSLTFTISTNIVGFGTLSSGAAKYATSDTNGTTTETEAHNLVISTNASSGYTATVTGATLQDSRGYAITAIGGTNTASSPGAQQFGLRLTATGGSGAVSSPYAASGFADAASTSTASQVASESVGDNVATTYSTRYIANITATTSAAVYNSILTYAVTANF